MTTSAVVYMFLFIHVGVVLVVTAYFTLGAALAPDLTGRARDRFARRPWLPMVLGLVISVPWVIATLVMLNLDSAAIKFVGAVAGCLWVLCGLIGGAAIAQHVGRGRADDVTSWVQTVRGGFFITLTWILPLVGWLGMLPLTLATGVGCLAMGILPARPAAPTMAPLGA